MPHSFADATSSERAVFLLFMLSWIIYGILNQYNALAGMTFDPAAVVWSQEVIKIFFSLALFLMQDGDVRCLMRQAREHWTMMLWYLIPAGLYALGDILTYINLRSFDPATLHLLGEMKLVVVAIVHQCVFRRMLNGKHWMALAIIVAGCTLKTLDSMGSSATKNGNGEIDSAKALPRPTLFNYGLIGLQKILMMTFSGVFNEKLLKEDKPAICINLQNLCLYLDGMLFLTVGMLAGVSEHKSVTEAISPTSLRALFSQPSILATAVTMSFGGIVTSRFLKICDSIRKSVAVALVVVSLPLLSRLFFGTPITAKMVLSILLVVCGMQMYTSQPPPKAADEQIKDAHKDESELFLNSIDLPGKHSVEDHRVLTSKRMQSSDSIASSPHSGDLLTRRFNIA